MTPCLLVGGGEACRRAEAAFDSSLREEGMEALFRRGVLLALSGGADSVLLFRLLLSYTACHRIPFAVAHVHHGIRGEEATRDADFCRTLAEGAAVPFFLLQIDVPAYRLAEGRGKGEEEAARELRYAALAELLAKEPVYGVCATAHNATDNLETVLFHMLRGSGLRGLAGVPPVRGVFVRPLLHLSKEDVLLALGELAQPYVTDSTNTRTDYTRNYIRAELLPRLLPIHPHPEEAVTRLSRNLREELDVAEAGCDSFFARHVRGGRADRAALAALPPAAAVRVLLRLYREGGGTAMPERVHYDALLSLLHGGRVSRKLDFPGRMIAVITRAAVFFVGKESEKEKQSPVYEIALHMGENQIDRDGQAVLWLLTDRSPEFEREQRNIYKLFIQANLGSATILKGLIARSRRPGDAYRYGGMTRRVRRLFSSAHLPPELRAILPVVCDREGVLWVPGFGVRDGVATQEGDPCLYAYFCYQKSDGRV